MDVVWYFVGDWEKAREFYEKKLGLKSALIDNDGGWAEYGEKDKTRLAIHLWRKKGSFKPGEGGTAAFAVDNLEAAVKDLKTRGVKCSNITYDEPVKITDIFDPWENKIQLIEIVAS